jgi:hypothetical protein
MVKSTPGKPFRPLSFTEDGLSDYDRAEVTAAVRLLPGPWLEQFKVSPSGKSYARLDRSGGHGRMPAFLLQRRDGLVVLIDRLTDQTQDLVTRHRNMTKAMKVVFTAVLAEEMSPRQG